jgi:diguanylate cyclase (GGDEF)-like protein
VLAFPDPELLPQPGEGDRLRLATLDELGDVAAAAAARLRRDLPDLARVDQAHFASFEAEGERFRLVFAPFLESDRWPWLMGVYAPEEQFATAIRRAQRQSVVLAVVIAVLVASAMFLLGPLLLGSYRALQREAYLDPLTALLNRRGFLAGAAVEIKQLGSGGDPLAAIMIDIDRFKAINDTYGHQVGDEVLVAVAGRLRCELPAGDLLARYGGEEFAVLAPATSVDEASQVAERLRAAVRGTPVHTSAGQLLVTISLGVAESAAHDGGLDGLLHRADTGLLRAKRAGRDRVVTVPLD